MLERAIMAAGCGLAACFAFAPRVAESAIMVPPPLYDAYVSGSGPGGIGTPTFQGGEWPNNLAPGAAGPTLAVGSYTDPNSGFTISATANLMNGDLSVSATGDSNVEALFFTALTFTGSGTGTVAFGGTISTNGPMTSAGEYVGVGAYLSPTYPVSTIDASGGLWSASSQFSYTNGETLYLSAELNASTLPGTVTVSDPLTLTLSPGTSVTAAAPGFLAPAAEPASLALFGIGLAGLLWARRRVA